MSWLFFFFLSIPLSFVVLQVRGERERELVDELLVVDGQTTSTGVDELSGGD